MHIYLYIYWLIPWGTARFLPIKIRRGCRSELLVFLSTAWNTIQNKCSDGMHLWLLLKGVYTPTQYNDSGAPWKCTWCASSSSSPTHADFLSGRTLSSLLTNCRWFPWLPSGSDRFLPIIILASVVNQSEVSDSGWKHQSCKWICIYMYVEHMSWYGAKPYSISGKSGMFTMYVYVTVCVLLTIQSLGPKQDNKLWNFSGKYHFPHS